MAISFKGIVQGQNSSSDDVLPPKYSLERFAPSAGNQLSLKTSTGWAAAYYGATILESHLKNISSRGQRTRNSFSPVYNYALLSQSPDCDTELPLNKLLENIKQEGIPYFTELMEFCPGEIPEEVEASAQVHQYFDFEKISDGGAQKEDRIERIKKGIYADHPVIAEVFASPSFKTAKEFWVPMENTIKGFPLQSVCVIGFDDERYGGAFQILNSWGKDWGFDGSAWVLYTDFVDFLSAAYELSIDDSKYTGDRTALTGTIEVVTEDERRLPLVQDNTKNISLAQNISTSNKFKIIISLSKELFFHLFYFDQAGHVELVYPDKVWKNPQIQHKYGTFELPGGEDHYFIDTNGEKEEFVFLFSKDQIDSKILMDKLNGLPGSSWDRLDSHYSGNISHGSSIQWADDFSTFSIVENEKSFYAVVLGVSSKNK